ncbi:homoserine dehydrogenase [Alicyclobacillus sacchari]|uniref:Homoserine dehydrogenase n=2 Tax=Alicyclobacillus sacchari TaxID=392010 RepID=A0A4R8LR58_9BACL|nr:homoserine dehydrogenase [Alicyclobacillus sacchari]TDY50063.1 homoserine dehydrogenase [Alicyclobacillus sacchari]
MANKVRLGLVGCGVVGSGVLRVLADRQGAWDGAQLEATHIAVRHLERPRPDFVPRHLLTDDWRIVCEADDVDIVIEVMGGIDVAHDVVRHALENGKSVVTANKALMALHGEELRDLASKRGLFLRHEASVLGGIPVLHTLHTYFDLNRVQSLRGIVNGTCNYILTQMHATGAAFASALQEAQALGYAEPDPAADVEGLDAYYKLQILLQALRVDTRLLATECVADGQSPNEMARNGVPTAVLTKPRAGISAITAAQMEAAKASGAKVKHVASAVWGDDGIVRCEVGPQVLQPDDPLYFVDGVNNAIAITGDVVGTITLIGPGAGALPTASAVLEDVLQMVRESSRNA